MTNHYSELWDGRKALDGVMPLWDGLSPLAREKPLEQELESRRDGNEIVALPEKGHYKSKKIMPTTYIHANKLDFNEGNIIKYISRWREKDGILDLKKIKDYVDIIIELEGLE